MIEHGIRAYKTGVCRCEVCCAANTLSLKLWKLGRCPKLIDPTGTKRRIEAMLWLGWTYRDLGDHAGRERGWAHALHKGHGRIREDTAALITAAYETLSMQIPEGRYVGRNRAYAAKQGYLPPLAWDDDTIDDPNAEPSGVPTPLDRGRGRPDEDRADALTDYLDWGWSLPEVLRELHTTSEALWTWCKRHDMRDAYDQLAARQEAS